jgi:hypothetical protein
MAQTTLPPPADTVRGGSRDVVRSPNAYAPAIRTAVNRGRDTKAFTRSVVVLELAAARFVDTAARGQFLGPICGWL